VRPQVLDESTSVVLGASESERERAETAQGEEHLERSGRGTVQLSMRAQTFLDRGVLRDRDAGEQVGVPTDVLRGAVHDHVGVEPQWLLEDRCGERVVDGDERAPLLRSWDDCRQVGDFQKWVRW
jgi:hypothetical protein